MSVTLDLTVTALYASLLALVFLGLSFNIIRLRRLLRVGVGDGGEKELSKAIRIHGNFSEYMPLALILLAAYELAGADSMWLHIIGATLVIGRILHAIGLSKTIGTSSQRFIGMVSTFLVLLILAILNIRLFLIG